ncbi:alpha/beta hydrolase [Jatrophihabitans endophyticus]|uniref:alpha/beta hydrolase n=1 Tax=Jatrophihabitans endophyticus TaxID=1206085 RepID=UPI0019F3F134|nr:alpha/beta hydrolase [Jatrophihabitans endophyticus]MBE7186793.1 alpha/beta hydrolase [Jatrophihabitans endophyticus]
MPPRRRSARLSALAAVVAAAAVLAGCTSATVVEGQGTARGVPGLGPSSSSPSSGSSGPSSTPATPTQPPASFQDCSQAFNLKALHFPAGRLAQLQFTCALIKVPLDYARPDGAKTDLLLVRVHDTKDTHPTGQLLMNPGGPGASGIELAVGLSPKMPQSVLDHFDLIGFDPRGVGQSSPITCTSNKRKDALNAASPDVLTRAGFTRAKALARSTAQACSRKYGSSLQYYDTVNTARDMDQVREAAGDSRMNYLGFSYGTELGSVYAHLFPHRIRAMVLDGAVDPLTKSIASARQQLGGFEGAFDQFAKYCVKTKPCRSIGNPRKAVYAIQAAARHKPLTVAGSKRTLTFSLATTGVTEALYSRSEWKTLGAALVAAKQGRGAGLLALADEYNERYANGRYSNISDANLTIGCNDSKPGPSDATIRATAKSWAAKYPMFGLDFAPGLFSCQQWQPHRTPTPLPTARTTPHTVLVLGNLHDPATPYQGALDLAKTMGHAEVLSWNGEGHTSYLEGSSCVNGYVNSYLDTLKLPPQHRTCPAK